MFTPFRFCHDRSLVARRRLCVNTLEITARERGTSPQKRIQTGQTTRGYHTGAVGSSSNSLKRRAGYLGEAKAERKERQHGGC